LKIFNIIFPLAA